MSEKIHQSLSSLIGQTPLLRLQAFERHFKLDIELLAKLEMFNPAGSAKDRFASYAIDRAEAAGELRTGSYLIEASSGNTGIAMAAVAAARGYKAIIVMPENMSQERIKLMRLYGAEVRLSPAALGMRGALQQAEQLAAELGERAYMLSQFSNPSNALVHERTTGPEILEACGGAPDLLVSAVGTGGTLTGIARYLKGQACKTRIVAVEPEDSPVLSGGQAGAHKIQGIGAGFVPEVLDTTLIDTIVPVSYAATLACAKLLPQLCGILGGLSSGAALAGVVELCGSDQLAKLTDDSINRARVVCILPDTGERYLSSEDFSS